MMTITTNHPESQVLEDALRNLAEAFTFTVVERCPDAGCAMCVARDLPAAA